MPRLWQRSQGIVKDWWLWGYAERATSNLSCGIRCECHCQSQERCLRQQTKHCLYDPTLELAATTRLWAGTGYLAHLSRSLNNVALPKYLQIGAFSSWRTHDLPQTVTASNRALLLQAILNTSQLCLPCPTLSPAQESKWTLKNLGRWTLLCPGGEQTVDLRGNCELWKQVQVWIRLDLRLNWPHTAHNRYKDLPKHIRRLWYKCHCVFWVAECSFTESWGLVFCAVWACGILELVSLELVRSWETRDLSKASISTPRPSQSKCQQTSMLTCPTLILQQSRSTCCTLADRLPKATLNPQPSETHYWTQHCCS